MPAQTTNYEKRYESGDLFLVAYIRMQGVNIHGVHQDGSRKKIVLDIGDAAGRVHEMAYRNSEFRRFQAVHSDTLDMVKRR